MVTVSDWMVGHETVACSLNDLNDLIAGEGMVVAAV